MMEQQQRPAAPSAAHAHDDGTSPRDLGFNGEMVESSAASQAAPAGAAPRVLGALNDWKPHENLDAAVMPDIMHGPNNPALIEAFGYLLG